MRNKRTLIYKFLVCIALLFVSMFVLNSKILAYNGVNYFALSEKSINSKAKNLLEDSYVSITYSDTEDAVEVPVKELGFDYSFDLNKCETNTKFVSYYDLNECSLFVLSKDEVLTAFLDNLNSTLSDSSDAYYKVTDKDIVLVQEVYGSKLNIKSAKKKIVKNIADLNIDLRDCTVKPTVCESDLESLTESIDILKQWGMSYTNNFKIDFKFILPYVGIENNNLVIDYDSIRAKLSSCLTDDLGSYNTTGIERVFNKTDGTSIKLSEGTYGDIVDIESEINFIISFIDSCTSSEDRIPEYILDLPDDIPNTYIEIDLDNQHLWYYIDGILSMETDIVTGTANTSRATPTGIYYISEKIAGKYLTGEDYKTWVNQWMRLTNSGIGLHDAYWRGSFGGSIYKRSGSHGCINLPKNFARDLYNIVERKTAVIIY